MKFFIVMQRRFHLQLELAKFSVERPKPRDVFAQHAFPHILEQNQPDQAIQELTITRVFASGQATTRRMFHSTVRYLPFQKTPNTSTCIHSYFRDLTTTGYFSIH